MADRTEDRTENRVAIRTDKLREHDGIARLEQNEDRDDMIDEGDLIGLVRQRLELDDDEISDVSIAASLARIAVPCETRERWLAAFGSPLGKHLAARGTDLNTALNALLALAPRQLS